MKVEPRIADKFLRLLMTWEDEGSWLTEIGAACLPVVVGGQTVRNELVGLIITCTKDERETGTAAYLLYCIGTIPTRGKFLYCTSVISTLHSGHRIETVFAHPIASHLIPCLRAQSDRSNY